MFKSKLLLVLAACLPVALAGCSGGGGGASSGSVAGTPSDNGGAVTPAEALQAARNAVATAVSERTEDAIEAARMALSTAERIAKAALDEAETAKNAAQAALDAADGDAERSAAQAVLDEAETAKTAAQAALDAAQAERNTQDPILNALQVRSGGGAGSGNGGAGSGNGGADSILPDWPVGNIATAQAVLDGPLDWSDDEAEAEFKKISAELRNFITGTSYPVEIDGYVYPNIGYSFTVSPDSAKDIDHHISGIPLSRFNNDDEYYGGNPTEYQAVGVHADARIIQIRTCGIVRERGCYRNGITFLGGLMDDTIFWVGVEEDKNPDQITFLSEYSLWGERTAAYSFTPDQGLGRTAEPKEYEPYARSISGTWTGTMIGVGWNDAYPDLFKQHVIGDVRIDLDWQGGYSQIFSPPNPLYEFCTRRDDCSLSVDMAFSNVKNINTGDDVQLSQMEFTHREDEGGPAFGASWAFPTTAYQGHRNHVSLGARSPPQWTWSFKEHDQEFEIVAGSVYLEDILGAFGAKRQ